MATKIVTKNSSTASAVPTASDLVQGELAVNVADKKLFTEDNSGVIIELADGVKLAGIEAGADVTDTANVTAAGALMDSELTSEASVKALNQGVATTDSPSFAGLTVDTTTLAVDSTNNRVGIGTTSPSAPLHVQKGSAGSSAFPSGDWAAKIFNQTDASTEHGLVVANRWQNNASTAFEVGGLLDDGNGFDTWMKVTGDGKVGIGTDSPSTYGGALNITDAAVGGESTLVIANNNANQFVRLGINNNTAQIAYDNADSLAFGEATDSTTAGLTTERMRIGTDGTVSTTGSIGVGRTSLSAATEDAGVVLSEFGYIYSAREGTSSQSHIVFINNAAVTATQVGTIRTSGSTTSYNTSSDYRLKTDAQPMTGATARLKALKPVNFEWIADGTRVDGFLAHEAQEVVPECVTGEKDAMQDQEYEVTPAVLDEEGNTVEEAVMGTSSVPDYQGIDQSKLVPLLVATIQELEARITQLENN